MGCYNSIIFKCPSCQATIEVQSKAGSCSLETFLVEEASFQDLAEIEDSIIECRKCHSSYKIKLQKIVSSYLLPWPNI